MWGGPRDLISTVTSGDTDPLYLHLWSSHLRVDTYFDATKPPALIELRLRGHTVAYHVAGPLAEADLTVMYCIKC